jgi:hypothetical protein
MRTGATLPIRARLVRMEIKGSHTYAASLDQVLSMMRDRDATLAKYEGMGHRDVELIECDGNDAALRIKSTRVVDVELPGFAKKVLKPTNTMIQTDEWHRSTDGGGWDGTFDVEVKGAPVHIHGSMRLTPDGAATTHDVTLHVDVKVPLIGGRIADWAAKHDVRRTLDAEYEYGDKWLAEHG